MNKPNYISDIPMNEGERQVALEIYAQAWEEVRHMQNMRTTYFNFFLVIVGTSIAAAFSFGQPNPLNLQWEIISTFGIVIWFFGVLTLVRIERLTALITHELHTVRQLRALIVSKYPVLKPSIPRSKASIEGVEFKRPLWSRDRSIEALACTISSCFGVGLAIFIAPLQLWAKIVLAMVAMYSVFWAWLTEVGHQREKHSKCCIGRRTMDCSTCKTKTIHHLNSTHGLRRHLLGQTVKWYCEECDSEFTRK
jgi:hypothetical protein